MAVAVPTILVSQRVDAFPDIGEVRDALDQRLSRFLVTAGFLPVPVPNAIGDVLTIRQWIDRVTPSGIVLSGGNDIGSAPERDATEIELLRYAAEHRLPLLGICRGLQMLVHAHGGLIEQGEGHVRTSHEITEFTNNGTVTRTVNSYHGNVIRSVPARLEVFATSADGTIEGVRHSDLPWEGWMWHPEREGTFNNADVIRLKELFRRD
ncbi:MAG: gamma-glutamyl-gamma-aminobutyrate hydrolase [Candidatus Kapabacteria bacterium]|nr:gamma-glutamyl-gamma-aminobutyrate hydrolase [Candidatus Kapabacteria bacterium]